MKRDKNDLAGSNRGRAVLIRTRAFATSSTSFRMLENASPRNRNLWCELLKLDLFFSPSSFLVPNPSRPPRSDSIQPSLLPMSLPPGTNKGVPEYHCTCRTCGSAGKVLTRSTWYRHNPGGKKIILPPPTLTLEQANAILSNPVVFVPRRKRRSEEETLQTPHTSKRIAGPSSVLMMSDHDICATVE